MMKGTKGNCEGKGKENGWEKVKETEGNCEGNEKAWERDRLRERKGMVNRMVKGMEGNG